jgi:hypothetical protein
MWCFSERTKNTPLPYSDAYCHTEKWISFFAVLNRVRVKFAHSALFIGVSGNPYAVPNLSDSVFEGPIIQM